VSGLTWIQDEINPHLELFLAIIIQVPPFLLLFFVSNHFCLVWMLGAVIRRMYILAVVVTLKRQNDEAN
jgi:hypothetical protein